VGKNKLCFFIFLENEPFFEVKFRGQPTCISIARNKASTIGLKSPQEWRLIRGSRAVTSFHELARVNSSLSFVLLTWISRTFMNSSSERLFHLAGTYESLSKIPGIPSKNGLTIRIALRPSASFFTFASSWNLASFNSSGG